MKSQSHIVNWLKPTIILLTLFLVKTPAAFASDEFSEAQKTFLKTVTSGYTDWQTVELNGKLHMSNLPVSPSLKIYMEKGKTLYISIRAPFVGEVGRIDLDGTQLTAVNKLKKIYVQENFEEFMSSKVPVKIEDVQDIFLARAFLLDFGTLSTTNQSLCRVYDESDCWLLVPIQQPEGNSVRYGYTFNFDGKLQDLYVTTISENYAALAQYSYSGKKTMLDIVLQISTKNHEVQFTFDEPKWNTDKSLKPTTITRQWQRVDFRTFLQSLRRF